MALVLIYLGGLLYYLKEKDGRPGIGFWILHLGLAGFVGLYLVSNHFSQSTSYQNAQPQSQSSESEIKVPTETQTASGEVTEGTPSLASPWNIESDGHDWNHATEDDKHKLCALLAANSNKGNSADYFYNGLNSFYNSTDTNVLDTKLNETTEMLEKGSDQQ